MKPLSWGLIGIIGCSLLRADDWPQWMGPTRDGVYRESGLLEQFPADGPKVRWRTRIGAGYAGPAVADGSVFVFDRIADATVQPEKDSAKPGQERLLCLDAATGRERWKKQWPAPYLIDYGSGPRATPTVHQGRVFVLGAEGQLQCLQATDGLSVWQKDLKKDYDCAAPTWGFAAAPLVHGDFLLCTVGGKGSACVALDWRTGQERWRSGTVSQIGYCPPLVVHHHGRQDVLLWTGDAILGFALANGKELWRIPWSIRFGVAIANPRQVEDTVLISSFWSGCRMLKLRPDGGTPDILWQTEKDSDTRTTHLNALMCSPVVQDGYFYGVCSYGHLRCLDWAKGERRWETLAATTGTETRWGNAFLTRVASQKNRWFLFNEKGELILTELSPGGYREVSRAQLLKPDNTDCGRPVVWTHPAYSGRALFARNDSEIICADLAKE